MESEAFWATLVSELPAFLAYLESWTIPAGIADSRYGVCAFQHPVIVEKLDETAPEVRLLEMIDGGIFSSPFAREPWTGTASELTQRLMREGSSCRDDARRMFSWGGACGSYLGRLEDSTATYAASRVMSNRVNGIRRWTISPPPLEARHTTPP